MKRWVWRVLLFLLIGAMVNIALAWGCAIHRFRHNDGIVTYQGDSDFAPTPVWPAPVPNGWPSPSRSVVFDRTTHTRACATGGEKNDDAFVVWVVQYGWPARSMQTTEYYQPRWAPAIDPAPTVWGRGIELPWHDWTGSGSTYELLPIRPVAAGFALDWAIFALLSATLILGPSAIRRVWRSRRGHCTKCNYDLAGITTGICPECGKAAAPAAP